MPEPTPPDLGLGLAGQTALVTGATGGLGRAIALTLARDGATVVVHGRDGERGEAAVAAISHAGGIAEVVAFLASPRASYITGAIVAADGGRTAI